LRRRLRIYCRAGKDPLPQGSIRFAQVLPTKRAASTASLAGVAVPEDFKKTHKV